MFISYSPDQWKVLPGKICEPSEVDFAMLIETDVGLREILADHPYQVYRAEKTGGDAHGWRSHPAILGFPLLGS